MQTTPCEFKKHLPQIVKTVRILPFSKHVIRGLARLLINFGFFGAGGGFQKSHGPGHNGHGISLLIMWWAARIHVMMLFVAVNAEGNILPISLADTNLCVIHNNRVTIIPKVA